MALLAFLRLSTSRIVFPSPLTVGEALEQVEDWLAQPSAVVVEPTARHLALVRDFLKPPGAGGNLVNDAHLAALAVEHRCEVVSYDTDYLRFPGVRLQTPGK